MENNNILKSSVILGLSFIIGLIIVSYSLVQIKSFDNLLVVTGSSKQLVVSDIAKWNASFSRNAYYIKIKFFYCYFLTYRIIVSKNFSCNVTS
jgi:hypothetical protein